jgi:HAD domain in Swiss Army Knife RNA repair proteins
MKVIFSDIDGVLNTRATPNPRELPYIVDKKLVRRLRQLCQQTRARVVLTSTWRYDPAGLFSARHHRIPYSDYVPDLPHRPRRDEILAWLRKHPRVSRYAVLDDDDDQLDELPLFQANPRTGLTPSLARALRDYLNGKTNKDRRRNKAVRMAENLVNTLTGHRG